ncbi:MAG: class II aldolase/adducin family protein [Dehalococcoidales bacterium]|nr:MAG: class II aldolase/adducin family protein [Dehalococcoidales bacterium]
MAVNNKLSTNSYPSLSPGKYGGRIGKPAKYWRIITLGLYVKEDIGVKFKTVFLSSSILDDPRKDLLIEWGKWFVRLGLAPLSMGNLSFRTEKGFVITATGIGLEIVEEDNLTEVLGVEEGRNLPVIYVNGKVVPSRESLLHHEIYKVRPEVKVVFHLHDELVMKCVDELNLPSTIGEQPPGSEELVREVNRLLNLAKNARYLVIRGHGIISMGETLEDTGRMVVDMNQMARDYVAGKMTEG